MKRDREKGTGGNGERITCSTISVRANQAVKVCKYQKLEVDNGSKQSKRYFLRSVSLFALYTHGVYFLSLVEILGGSFSTPASECEVSLSNGRE